MSTINPSPGLIWSSADHDLMRIFKALFPEDDTVGEITPAVVESMLAEIEGLQHLVASMTVKLERTQQG